MKLHSFFYNLADPTRLSSFNTAEAADFHALATWTDPNNVWSNIIITCNNDCVTANVTANDNQMSAFGPLTPGQTYNYEAQTYSQGIPAIAPVRTSSVTLSEFYIFLSLHQPQWLERDVTCYAAYSDHL